MRRFIPTFAIMAGAVLISGGVVAASSPVVDLRLTAPSHRITEIPEPHEIIDSAGPSHSNATQRINFPRWVASMPDHLDPIPDNPDLGAPANGVALRLGQSHGFRFGTGADNEIADALTGGPFTLFIRVLNDGGDLRFRMADALSLRFNLESSNLYQLDALVYQDRAPTGATYSATRTERVWSDIVLRFDPDTPPTGLQTFVNGELLGQMSVLDQPIDAATGGFEFEQTRGSRFAYMESLRIYDRALSDREIAALSVVPEPAVIGIAGPAALLLLSRRRNRP